VQAQKKRLEISLFNETSIQHKAEEFQWNKFCGMDIEIQWGPYNL
jgi:hypothetical protein